MIVILIVLSLSAAVFVGSYRKPEPEMVLRVTETEATWMTVADWNEEWEHK